MSYLEIVDNVTLLDELYRKEYYQFKSDSVNARPDALDGKYLKLNSNQAFDAMFMNPNNKNRVLLNTGQAGCHPRNTPILMHDMSAKMCQDIMPGDILLGTDSKPRKVLGVATGSGKMYKIQPTANLAFECNAEHILCLYSPILDVHAEPTISEYLGDPRYREHGFMLWSSPICNIDHIEAKNKAILAELMRCTRNPCIYSQEDADTISHVVRMSYNIRAKFLGLFIDSLTTRVDRKFKILQIYYIDIDTAAMVVQIARSLAIVAQFVEPAGYIQLYGQCLSAIPSKLCKQLYPNPENVPKMCTYEFTISGPSSEEETYYGMSISDDQRYILAGSYIVTHNSGKTLPAIEAASKYTELFQVKYNEISAQIGTSKFAQNELDTLTPSIFVLGATSTISAFVTELLKYPEYGFITSDEVATLETFRVRRMLETAEYAEFFNRLKHRITNKAKGGFYVFYGYQTFVNRLFSSEKIRLVDLDKIYLERLKTDQDATMYDLITEYVADGTIIINTALVKRFENSLLICDEIHHTWNSDSKNNYGVSIQYLMDNVPSLRAIFMSATPINNSPSEVVDVMSMLTGKQYIKRDLFTNNKFLRPGALETIRQAFTGKVSFVQDINPALFPSTIFMGETLTILADIDNFHKGDLFPYIKVWRSRMSPAMQDALHEIISKSDKVDEPPYSFHKILPANYTIFDGVFPGQIYTKQALGVAAIDARRTGGVTSEGMAFKEFKGDTIPTGPFLHADQIGKWFPKYRDVLDILATTFPAQSKAMIIHTKVRTSGVLLIQELLLMNGYISADMYPDDSTICAICGIAHHGKKQTKQAEAGYNIFDQDETKNETNDKTKNVRNEVTNVGGATKADGTRSGTAAHEFAAARFLMAHSDMDKHEIETNRNLYNQEANIHGHLFKVFIGSMVIKEGFTFKEVQDLIICNFPVNFPSLKQFIGRAVRKFSHLRLPPESRNVRVYLLVTGVGDGARDVHSPEEYKYIDKISAYQSIQQIEKVINENAVDASINRSIIAPGLDAGGDSFASIYFDEATKLQPRKLEELSLSTFYAYKFYAEEIRWITFIVKRLFYVNIVWNYDDLWAAVKRPPFGVEFNTELIAEGNFIRVMIDLTDDNLYVNVPAETSLGNMFDFNHKIITKGGTNYKIEHCGSLFILFEYDIKARKSHINPNTFLKNISTNVYTLYPINDFMAETHAAKRFDHVATDLRKRFALSGDEKLTNYDVLNTSNEFQRDLIRNIIENVEKLDEFGRFVVSVYNKFGIWIKGKKEIIGYRAAGGVNHTYAGHAWSSQQNANSAKGAIPQAVIGYVEDVDYFATKFKVRHKPKNTKDNRLEDRGIVCETQQKEAIAKYLKILGVPQPARVKSMCNLIMTTMIDKTTPTEIYFELSIS
jgi:hypothetical protein